MAALGDDGEVLGDEVGQFVAGRGRLLVGLELLDAARSQTFERAHGVASVHLVGREMLAEVLRSDGDSHGALVDERRDGLQARLELADDGG